MFPTPSIAPSRNSESNEAILGRIGFKNVSFNHVDRVATLALLHGKLTDVPRDVKELVKVEDIANQVKEAELAVEAIIAGSVLRPNC